MEKKLVLEWVPPGQHTAEDLEFILKADENQPVLERIPLLQIDHGLRMNRMQLFRVHPNKRGVILTEVRSSFGVKRLSLLRGAGQVGFQIPAILDLLAKTAREWGCECIETVVYSARVKEALERVGVKTEGYILTYGLEADDGQ